MLAQIGIRLQSFALANEDGWTRKKFLCGCERIRCQPSQRISSSSDSRTEMSSTTNTSGVACKRVCPIKSVHPKRSIERFKQSCVTKWLE